MKCENYYCIYEEKRYCLLNSIELDIIGQCKECIYVDIDDNELKILKEKTRKEIEKI